MKEDNRTIEEVRNCEWESSKHVWGYFEQQDDPERAKFESAFNAGYLYGLTVGRKEHVNY